MKTILSLGAIALCATLVACGGTDETVNNGFPQPAGTVPVNFTVNDTANKVFKAGELQWKGGMTFDSVTRKATKSGWDGPWATLYDDGPWTTGGHEPVGELAGDNKWGITVFVTPSTTAQTFEYGLIDHAFSDSWLWKGSNGTFTVPAAGGSTAAIKADGITLPAFGAIDLQFVIDKNALSAGTWDTSKVVLKGSALAWIEIELKDDGLKGDAVAGDGKFTLKLSEYAGLGKTYYHTGLAASGDKPEFIAMFNGLEYKDGSGNGLFGGITAGTKAGTATAFTTQTITLLANKNPSITVP